MLYPTELRGRPGSRARRRAVPSLVTQIGPFEKTLVLFAQRQRKRAGALPASAWP
jgi:hypothetical protein